MNKIDAIETILVDANKNRATKTGYKKVKRSLEVLGLSPDEVNACLASDHLNYVNPTTGEVREWAK